MIGTVNASSKHTDEAVLFVKELFGNEQQILCIDGIQVNMDALEAFVEYDKDGMGSVHHHQYYTTRLMYQNFDEVVEALQTLDTVSNPNAEIKEMIKSGMQAYCEGEKTLDEAVKDTGELLKLYLSE